MKKCDTEHTQSSHFLQETWKEVQEFLFGPIYIDCELVGYVFLSFLFNSSSPLWTQFRLIPASSVLKDFTFVLSCTREDHCASWSPADFAKAV